MIQSNFKSGYSVVNGLNMYYEIYGQGNPLVLLHGGGSTIETSFRRIIPFLSKQRQIIGVELQAHGHTADRDSDLSFEQDADDVAALLHDLKIAKADFLGFSNGGHTVIEIALRHPSLINKIILCSTFYNRSAVVPQFWEGFDHATINEMPEALQKGQLAANGNDAQRLVNMFNKDVQRMKTFRDWTKEQIKSIQAPTLIINGNNDVGSIEHAAEMKRLIPNSELVIFPGGHGTYLGSIDALDNGNWPQFNAGYLIEEFLNK